MAIGGGKVLAWAATRSQAPRGTETQMRDLNGAGKSVTVFPGFNDAHTHLGEAGRTKLNVDLTGVQSLAAMLAEVGEGRQGRAGRPLAHRRQLGPHAVGDKTLPTRQELDKVTPGHPAFLGRIDGHIAIANTAALAAAGITGQDGPAAGRSHRSGRQGEPTGILRESAQELVSKVIPPPSHDERKPRRRVGHRRRPGARRHQRAGLQRLGGLSCLRRTGKGRQAQPAHQRVAALQGSVARTNQDAQSPRPNDPLLHTGMLKGFMDGSLGSRTAAHESAVLRRSRQHRPAAVHAGATEQDGRERAQAGFQLGFHAIGDKAAPWLGRVSLSNRCRHGASYSVLAALPAPYAMRKPLPNNSAPPKIACPVKDGTVLPRAGLAHRIEHAQVVDPADIPRFKKARRHRLHAAQPPAHRHELGRGPPRSETRRLLLCLEGLSRRRRAAGLRHRLPGRAHHALSRPLRRRHAHERSRDQELFPENKLTRGQALYAYTQGSAYAEFAEKQRASLPPATMRTSSWWTATSTPCPAGHPDTGQSAGDLCRRPAGLCRQHEDSASRSPLPFDRPT
jgi:predicted amidohydrolase YtcJ